MSFQIDKRESHKGEKDKCSDYSDFCFHCVFVLFIQIYNRNINN